MLNYIYIYILWNQSNKIFVAISHAEVLLELKHFIKQKTKYVVFLYFLFYLNIITTTCNIRIAKVYAI